MVHSLAVPLGREGLRGLIRLRRGMSRQHEMWRSLVTSLTGMSASRTLPPSGAFARRLTSRLGFCLSPYN